jgi:hypothetical protein
MKDLLCEKGNGRPEGYERKGKDDIMVMWGNPFILVAFKTLGLFNTFLKRPPRPSHLP